QHEADMQFVGQTHVLTVPIARTDFAREDLAETFERAYRDRFGVELREMRALVMSLRTAVIGRRRPIALEGLAGGATGSGPVATRRVWFGHASDLSEWGAPAAPPTPPRRAAAIHASTHGRGADVNSAQDGNWFDTPIYLRDHLPVGATF